LRITFRPQAQHSLILTETCFFGNELILRQQANVTEAFWISRL